MIEALQHIVILGLIQVFIPLILSLFVLGFLTRVLRGL